MAERTEAAESEPRGQAPLAFGLLGALAIVVFGTLIGSYLAIHNVLGGATNWLGLQGFEYLDLARLWQILLTVGLIVWVFMLWRVLRRRLAGEHPGKMPWRRRKPTSIVSAREGRNYNTWLEVRGVRSGDRPSMRSGWIVDYNHVRLRPGVGPRPVPHKGSGIFYHTSKPGHRWAPTEGCTQVGNPAQMRWLLRWLRPESRPRIVQDR